MKRIFTVVLGILIAGMIAAAPAKAETPMNPVLVQFGLTNGLTVKNTVSSAPVSAMSLYIVGGATTSAASYLVCASSICFTTVGGLHPGTTCFLFADSDKDTIAELVSYCNAVSTTTPGAEGGIVVSTIVPNALNVATSLLTQGTGACKGAANAKVLTVTPAAGQTSTMRVFVDSVTFTTTNGLYPGTTQYVFADADKSTLASFKAFLAALPAYTCGIDGTLAVSVPNGTLDTTPSTELSTTTALNIKATTQTLALDRSLGLSWKLCANSLDGFRYSISGINANATYASGSVYLKVYNGSATTNTQIFQYKLNATGTETPILSIPSGIDFHGDFNTTLRFDVEGSSWVTAGYLGLIGSEK